MYPDKIIVWAYQCVNEPMRDGNDWIVNYKDANWEWTQAKFTSHNSASIFYATKILEYKEYYANLLRQRGRL